MGLNESSEWEKLTKSEKSSLASLRFVEFAQGHEVCLKRKGNQKDPHGPVQGSASVDQRFAVPVLSRRFAYYDISTAVSCTPSKCPQSELYLRKFFFR